MKITYYYKNVLNLVISVEVSDDVDLEQYVKEKLIIIEEVEKID